MFELGFGVVKCMGKFEDFTGLGIWGWDLGFSNSWGDSGLLLELEVWGGFWGFIEVGICGNLGSGFRSLSYMRRFGGFIQFRRGFGISIGMETWGVVRFLPA